MCGLAGVIRFDDRPIEPATLDRMILPLRPRGPDGRGLRIVDRCGLAHTRLAVVDLMGGHQPMNVPPAGEHGALWLVFNGEIYNHRKLRSQLEALGHRFVTDHCDTEVLLHGYRQWGAELPKHLHGMFAFAVYDAQHRSLFCARDRAGKKPLHLYRDHRQVVFASLIGSLLAGLDATPDIDRAALGRLLTFGYTGCDSVLRGVTELPAGHWMRVETAGHARITIERYWRPPPLSRSVTDRGAVEGATELITEAVNARLEADVPLGCFLSGGIDSSLIAAVAQKQLGGERLKTFSVAMPEAAYDEGPFARRVAEHIGSEHHELIAHPKVEDDLKHLIATLGEPFGDSSILPTFWLSRATREHVSVALSGDGGDELFGGYDRYRAVRLLGRHAAWLRLVPGAAGLGAGAEGKTRRARLGRLADAARARDAAGQYLRIVRLFNPQQIGRLGFDVAPIDAPPDWPDHSPPTDPAESARRWDLANYLPFDLLRKTDRASMAVALEVRCPLLDTQVIDFAAHVPLAVLAPGRHPKKLLRRVAAPLLPPDIVRRPKMGFAVPIGRWFRDDCRALLRNWLLGTDHLAELGCRPAQVHRMIEQHADGLADHTHRLFTLLTLAMWRDGLTHLARPGAAP